MTITQTPVETGAWVRRFHPDGRDAAHRLICFPHAGGSASFYFPVSRALTPGVDVLAIQYPGRQDRRHEPCIDSIAALADALAEEVRPWCDRPVTFFGHSMGATLAFEVARRLEAEAPSCTDCSPRVGAPRPPCATSGCTCATTTACSRTSPASPVPTPRSSATRRSSA